MFVSFATYGCNNHEPVIETKGLDHADADKAPQQAGQDGRGDKGNVDCEQLGASIGDGHDDCDFEAADALAAESPKIGRAMELEGICIFNTVR